MDGFASHICSKLFVDLSGHVENYEGIVSHQQNGAKYFVWKLHDQSNSTLKQHSNKNVTAKGAKTLRTYQSSERYETDKTNH